MALKMIRTRDSVRFHWTDGEVESVVTLLGEESEDEATLIRKLKRVIALVEGGRPTIAAWPADVQGPEVSGGIASDVPPPVTGNGWKNLYEPPPVPEGAEFELIHPPEEAG